MTGDPIEWEWEAFAATAFEAYQSGGRAEAFHLWGRASEISSSFAADDPRRVASINNLAVGSLVDEQFQEAASGFAEATVMWNEAMLWVERMDVEPVGRSSLFHLRMAERHKDAFATVRRSRWRELLSGAKALTRFNHALACLFLDEDAQADRLLAKAAKGREISCGPINPELAQIFRVIAGREECDGKEAKAQDFDLKIQTILAADSRSPLTCWKEEQPAELSDPRRLLAAAQLTVMVHERDFM